MKVSIKNKPISYRITIFILLIFVMTVPLLVAGVFPTEYIWKKSPNKWIFP